MNNIKELRKKNHLSQKEFSKLCNVHQTAVSQWETNKSTPDKGILIFLSKHFNVTLDYLLDNAEKKETWIPVLGYVKAGIPLEAIEEILDYEEITSDMAAQGEHFGLVIMGDSMEPRFEQGDVVIVRKQTYIDTGDIAVVLVDGLDATVKKIIKKALA